MEKTCFVIMPISDNESYPIGHFARVYSHIIKPACELVGFKAIRADEIMTTNYIAIDILKNIINCDMAVCDLSSRNPNVLYELGIRQAFNLPVTLMKDSKTERIFDIQGFRDVEYDETLRIDTVESSIKELAETIKNTYSNKNEINSLVSLLSIEPAKLSEKTKISSEAELILTSLSGLERKVRDIETRVNLSIHNGSQLSVASPQIPDDVGDIISPHEFDKLKKGDLVYHTKYGIGQWVSFGENVVEKVGIINFSVGQRALLLSFSKLRWVKDKVS